MNPVKKLTEEEINKVSGGFAFDYDYVLKKKSASLKCPVCGAEGTLETQTTGTEGYGDGSEVAVDTSLCSSCGVQVDIMPQLNKMRIVRFTDGMISEEEVHFNW